jgi:hypothetical protein
MKKSELCRSKNSILRAVAALGVSVVFATFACIACLAWFNVSGGVTGSGANIYVKSISIDSVDVTYYKYSSSTTSESGVDYATYVECDSAALGTFSPLSSGKEYRIIIKAVFYGSLTSLSLDAVSNAENYLGAYGTNGKLLSPLKNSTDENPTVNSLSSIIQFYILDSSSVTTGVSGELNTCVISEPSANTAKQFFTLDNTAVGGYTFTQRLNLIDGAEVTEGDTQGYTAYILLDYNQETMLDIFGKNLGNANISNISEVKFNDCDFCFEVY